MFGFRQLRSLIGLGAVRLDRRPQPGSAPGRRGLQAAILVFALAWAVLSAFRSQALAASISGVEVRPNPFTPNGDGVTDTTELIFTPGGDGDSVSAWVSVFEDSGAVLVETLLSGDSLAVGAQASVVWAPLAISDGLYRLEISATDASGSAQAVAWVQADTEAPSVALGSLVPNPFDPQTETLIVPFSVTTTDSGTATQLFVRQTGAVVDSLGSAAGPGVFQLSWDGRLGTEMAASGTYEILALAADLAGNAGRDSQQVTLDDDAPVIMADFDTLKTTSLPDTITGTAVDEDRLLLFEVSRDSGATYVAADSTAGTADSLSFWIVVSDSAAVPVPGFRKLVLRAEDAVGHVAASNVIVAYDSILPTVAFSEIVDGGPSFANGDSVHIRTQWNAADFTVTADFSSLDSRYTTGAERVTDEGGGSYLVDYRIAWNNTRNPGTRLVRIRATTGVLSGADTLDVVLVAPAVTGLASIDRNRFDPLAGERATIAVRDPTAGLVVQVFDLSGRRVVELTGVGSVTWDGRNEEGKAVASGVYFLQVESGGADEVRKIAVVRGGGS